MPGTIKRSVSVPCEMKVKLRLMKEMVQDARETELGENSNARVSEKSTCWIGLSCVRSEKYVIST